VTSAFVKEALDKGREMFGWGREESVVERQEAGATRARGIGVAVQPLLRRVDRIRRTVHHQA